MCHQRRQGSGTERNGWTPVSGFASNGDVRSFPHTRYSAAPSVELLVGFAIPVLTESIGEWLAYWRKRGV